MNGYSSSYRIYPAFGGGCNIYENYKIVNFKFNITYYGN